MAVYANGEHALSVYNTTRRTHCMLVRFSAAWTREAGAAAACISLCAPAGGLPEGTVLVPWARHMRR